MPKLSRNCNANCWVSTKGNQPRDFFIAHFFRQPQRIHVHSRSSVTRVILSTLCLLSFRVCKFAYCSCGVFFCFVCGTKLTQADHYRHFTGEVGKVMHRQCALSIPALKLLQSQTCLGPGLAGPFGNVCLGPSDPNWKKKHKTKKETKKKKPIRAPQQRKPQKKKQPAAPKLKPKRRKNAKNSK